MYGSRKESNFRKPQGLVFYQVLIQHHPTFSQFNIASFHLKGGRSAHGLQDLQGLSQAAQKVLHGPEACVFFATTTVGTYEKTWTAEYMQPNADWRDSYMATWQNDWPGRG